MIFEPFYGMGLNFMGIYMKPSAFYIGNQNISVVINYTTKWVGAKALHNNKTKKQHQ
jgi:hypothetical protein